MYSIRTMENHLLVEFKDDFNSGIIRAAMRHETSMPEFKRMNDIWLIGQHRALVTLSDFAPVMADVESLYPKDATRNKTALVVSPGLTLGIVQLWVKQYKNRLPFNCRVFNTLDKAEEWIGVF